MKKLYSDIISILNKSERRKFYILAILSLLISVADIFSLVLLLFIINFYTQQAPRIPVSFLPGWLLNKDSILLIAFFLFFFALKNIIGYFLMKAQYRFVYNVAGRISETNLLKYLEGIYDDYVNIDSAVHIRNISQQPVEFAHYVLSGVQQIFTEAMLILFTVVAVLFFNAPLFLLLFVVLVPGIFLISWLMKTRLKLVRAQIKSTGEKSLRYLQEALSGFIESNIYDKNNFFTNRYANYQQKVNDHLAEMQSSQGISSRLMEVIAVLGLFVLIAVNKLSGNEQAVSLITIAAFMAAAYKIIPGIVRILNIAGQIKTYSFTVYGLIHKGSTQREQKMQNADSNVLSAIRYDKISFSYSGKHIINNFSVEIKTGEFIGISALSGKGKTTLVNLLLGFLDADSGDIFINGLKTNMNERKHWWKNISYIKQQSFFIHDSILKNITLDENNFDKTKMDNAVESTGLNELLHKFPEGIQKIIKENGKNISGGQRQRIAIARALYKDADLIILDEPFNELDEASELLLVKHFRQLVESGKMVVLITHNKETLSFCDKIISLDA